MSSHLSDLRVDGHKLRLYFGAFVGSVVLSATVDSAPADKALSLAITVVSGSASDVYRGFQVRVYRADGTTLKGVTNVRAAGTISSTSLPIRELGQADIVIAAGDVVKVYNVPFLGDKLPSDDVSFAPDGLTYSTQGSAIAPNTASGGHRMGMVDTGQSYRTELMAGSGSATLDPDSGGTGAHLWTLLTGTLAFAPGSANTDANPTIRASVGYGLALHRFTDSSNSASWSQFVCFQVYDADNPPKRVLDANIDGIEDSGWSSEFETYAYSTLAELPDGTLGALFVRETINGVDTSYGASVSGLSHLKCLGFLAHDENDLQPSIRRLRFRLQSPWQRLAGLPGFSKVITRATGADWTTVEGLTVLLGIFHLLHYYGFFTELFDVGVDAAFLDKAYAQFFLQKQTADGQIKELAAGVDARVTNLRGGALALHTHPCYIPLAERAAVPVTLTVAERDCLKAGVVRDHWKIIETFEGRGLSAGSSSNDPLFSRYTGNTPGRGNVTVSAEKKIWNNQTDANQRTGRLAAKEDGTYIDANGAQVRAVAWTPTLFGSYDVFDFYKEYVATSLDAASNRRGVDLSAMLYYLNRVSVRYQGGTARVEPTFLTATNAPSGATYIPTPGEVPVTTPIGNIPPPYVPPIIGLRAGLSTIIAVNTDGYRYKTTDFETTAALGGPSWVRNAIPGLTGNVIDSVQDAFTLSRQIVVTDNAAAIYTVETFAGTMATTLRKTLRAAITDLDLQWRMVDASFGGDYIVVASFYGNSGANSGVWYSYSLNGGITWSTETNVTAHYSDSAGSNVPGLFVSSRAPGVAYLAAFTASGHDAAAQAELYQLSSAFSSQSATGISSNDILAGAIHKSWADNENTLYYGYGDFSLTAPNRSQMRRKVGSGAAVDITPTIGTDKTRPWYARGVHTCPLDANTVLAAVAGNASGAVIMSRDKGTTWTQLTAGTTTNYRGAEVAGNDRDVGYVWGSSGAIGAVDLALGVIDDRSGNLSSFTPGRFVRIRGG